MDEVRKVLGHPDQHSENPGTYELHPGMLTSTFSNVQTRISSQCRTARLTNRVKQVQDRKEELLPLLYNEIIPNQMPLHILSFLLPASTVGKMSLNMCPKGE